MLYLECPVLSLFVEVLHELPQFAGQQKKRHKVGGCHKTVQRVGHIPEVAQEISLVAEEHAAGRAKNDNCDPDYLQDWNDPCSKI